MRSGISTGALIAVVLVVVLAVVGVVAAVFLFKGGGGSEGLRVGHYFNYSISSEGMQVGYVYMKIVDENETHFKIEYTYAYSFLGDMYEDTYTDWVSKDDPFNMEDAEKIGSEEITVMGKTIKADKYDLDGTILYVYKGVVVKGEEMGATLELTDTNAISIP